MKPLSWAAVSRGVTRGLEPIVVAIATKLSGSCLFGGTLPQAWKKCRPNSNIHLTLYYSAEFMLFGEVVM